MFVSIEMNLFQSDLKSWIFTLIFGGSIFLIVKFYIKVFNYPRGPLPLPLVGSFYSKKYFQFSLKCKWNFILFLLEFIGLKDNSFYGFLNLAKSYGSVYTFWMGPMPWVVITDLESAKEAFLDKKNEFAGRPKVKLCKWWLIMFFNSNKNLLFSWSSFSWRTNRYCFRWFWPSLGQLKKSQSFCCETMVSRW